MTGEDKKSNKSRDDLTNSTKPEDHIDELSSSYHKLLLDYYIQGEILEVSNQILLSGNTSNPLENAFKSVINICQHALGGDTSVIEIYDAELDKLVGVATNDGEYKPEGYFHLPLEEKSLSGLAFHAGHTVAIDDVINDERVSQRIRGLFKACSGIAAPLLVNGKPIGVLLTMMQSPHHFTERDISLMEGLALETALAIHDQMLHKSRIQAEHRFQRLSENAPCAILLLDRELNILEANLSATKMFRSTADLTSVSIIDFISKEDIAQISEGFKQLKMDEELRLEAAIISHDRQKIIVEINANLISITGRSVIQAFFIDITQRKQAEAALHDEKERAQITLQSIADGVITIDHHRHMTSINLKGEELTGWSLEEDADVIVDNILRMSDEDTSSPISRAIDDCLLKGETVELRESIHLLHRNGDKIPVELSIAPILDSSGKTQGSVIVIHDVSKARKMAEEMSFLASHDALTGLANRREFEHHLSEAIESAVTDNETHTLCFMDLDRFKIVNDTAGHLAGDELLKQIASAMHSKIRSSDLLARLGGDEFGILFRSCSLDKATEVAEMICKLVKNFEFIWEGTSFVIGASIGLTPIRNDTGELKEVIQAADSACYFAKDRGRDCVQIFNPDDENFALHHGEGSLIQRIRDSLEENKFCLWQQRIIPLGAENAHVNASEILVRMHDESGEIILPDIFIPTAERYQLMPCIDRWVINAVFDAINDKRLLTDENSLCFINLSGQSLCDGETLELIFQKLEATSILPEKLCFEITETAAISNLADAMAFLAVLQNKGCQFALDDFGSGLSSFAYLKNLPVNFLKIDGHFIKDMINNPFDYAMVEAIGKIGHVMGIQTIGEFVEDTVTQEALIKIGINFAQGFAIEKPAPLPLQIK